MVGWKGGGEIRGGENVVLRGPRFVSCGEEIETGNWELGMEAEGESDPEAFCEEKCGCGGISGRLAILSRKNDHVHKFR